MQIELKEVDYCKLNVSCSASPDEVNDARDKVLTHFKDKDVPGFRKGKVPIAALKMHFKQKIAEMAKHELAQAAFDNTLNEHNIKPFGMPNFLSMNIEGETFKCEFNLHKIPEVELKKYKEFELPKGNTLDAIEMGEKILQELRVLNGDTIRFEENDFIQTGDAAIINYTGFSKDKKEPEIAIEGENFIVGQADVDAFNENLLGMKIGEIREFTVKMPENSSAQHIANKEIKFNVELIMASKRILPGLDNEFAAKMGAKDIDDLMSQVKGMASSKAEEYKNQHLSAQVAARLIENHQFEIPEWLSATEAKWIATQNNANWDNIEDEQKKELIDIAARNVKLSIILDKIRQEEPEAQMTDEEVYNSVRSNLHYYRLRVPALKDKNDQEVLNLLNEKGFMPSLMSGIKDDFTMNFIIKSSKIVE